MEFDYSKEPGKERKREFCHSVEKVLVTIITPYYNAGKYFEQTFNSVINQTFPWFEWIIVNDGSTNKEGIEILNRLAVLDARIRVVNQENGGLSCARNTGFENAATDLVVTLDADDLLAPQYVECLYWAMYYNPDAAWGYTDSLGFSGQEYIWKKKFNAKQLKNDNFLVATAMIRKTAYEEIGGYKVEKYSYNEDWRFWLEMLCKHKKPVHVNMVLFWYRRLPSGMLSTIKKNPEQIRFNNNIINEASKNVDTKIKAVEYPEISLKYPYYRSKYINWSLKCDVKKDEVRMLWLIPQMVIGGAEKFDLDAINGLKDKNYRNYILTTVHNEQVWQQQFEEATDEVYCLTEFLDVEHYLEYISYFIQSRQIDVLMVTNSYTGYYMVPWIRQHFPNLIIIDYVHMEEWNWREGGYARTSGLIGGITEKTYVCNSKTRNVMINQFGRNEQDVECMYIGTNHNYFNKELVSSGYLHDMLKLDNERSIVLFPCRIAPQKRPFMMLEIAQEVAKSITNVAFVVAGDGPQLGELNHEIDRKNLKDNVYCIGATDRIRECYRDSNLVLICSINEGLSLTAYEACSMGVPVVSADVGGQHDLIDKAVGALVTMRQDVVEDEDSRVFPREEILEYADNIVRILSNEDLASSMGQNARKKIESGFSVEKMVEHLDREIKKLLTDESAIEHRKEISEGLNNMPQLSVEFYMNYLRSEKFPIVKENIKLLYSLYYKLLNIPIIKYPVKHVGEMIYRKMV